MLCHKELVAVLLSLTLYNKHSCSNNSCRLSCTTGSHAENIVANYTLKKNNLYWLNIKTWNGLLLLDSNSSHRLTWIKTETETWQTCQVISSNIVFWCCSGQLQQSLGLLLRAEGCSNRWDCCYEHRVAAIAGIAVTNTRLRQVLALPF